MPTDRTELMTLDTFPVNDRNRPQYNLCRELLLSPKSFRLVYFQLPADERLHLKYSILNYLQDKEDLLSVTASEFVDDLISGIMGGTFAEAQEPYLQHDILLVDDLEHLSLKQSTQDELYIIIKKRLENRKLTILLSEFGLETLRITVQDDLIHLLKLGIHEEC